MLNFKAYKFANQLWIDKILPERLPARLFLAVLIAIIPWLIGLVIANQGGLSELYIKTNAFYIGSVGIALTLVSLRYGSSAQYKVYKDFFECFDIGENQGLKLVKKTIALYSDKRRHFRSFLTCLTCGLVPSLIGFFIANQDSAVAELGLVQFQRFKEMGWYRPEIRGWSISIISVYAVAISLPLSTAIYLILRMPIIIMRAIRLPVILPPRFIKNQFAAMASFYATISILWILGVSLFYYFLNTPFDLSESIILAFLTLCGLAIFVIPQIAYAKVVAGSEERFLSVGLAKIYEVTEVDSKNRIDVGDCSKAKAIFSNLKESGWEPSLLLQHESSVYPIHETYLVLFGYAGSILIPKLIDKIIQL